MTSEKLIHLVSILIVSVTVVFSAVVVIKEVMKPQDAFERIAQTECSAVTTLSESPEDEKTLLDSNSECILLSSDRSKKTGFSEMLFSFGRLNGLDYLYSGKKGVLVKKIAGNRSADAAFALECIRKNECSKKSERTVTATFVMLDSFGKVEISETYNDLPLYKAAKSFNKLVTEISKIRKIDASSLRLKMFFHSSYAYIEDKTPEHVISLLKRGVDGLFLKSRGASIRVLPWEYSDNPVNVIDRKGRQYGLDKEEYKKDEASFYHYRTEQFIEKNGNMIPWAGAYSEDKKDYSDSISLLFISKHIKNIQKDNGLFPFEIETSTGEEIEGRISTNILIPAVSAIFRAGEALNDEELKSSALKAFEKIAEKEDLSEISKGYMLDFLELCKEMCVNEHTSKMKNELTALFNDAEKLKEMIDKNAVFTGVFLRAFSISAKSVATSQKTVDILKISFNKFNNMKDADKLRFISHLSFAGFEPQTEPGKMIVTFFNEQTDFIKENLFDNRGFSDFSGSFRSFTKKTAPDTAMSLFMASGLSKAVSAGYHNDSILQMEGSIGIFLRFLIVTDDDFPNWGKLKAKSTVQGGVKSAVGAEAVKFSNSYRALDYFVNRVSAGRTR